MGLQPGAAGATASKPPLADWIFRSTLRRGGGDHTSHTLQPSLPPYPTVETLLCTSAHADPEHVTRGSHKRHKPPLRGKTRGFGSSIASSRAVGSCSDFCSGLGVGTLERQPPSADRSFLKRQCPLRGTWDVSPLYPEEWAPGGLDLLAWGGRHSPDLCSSQGEGGRRGLGLTNICGPDWGCHQGTQADPGAPHSPGRAPACWRDFSHH